jgi:hypothetical protein
MAKRFQNKGLSLVPPVAGGNSWIEPVKLQWFVNTNIPLRNWAQKALYSHATTLPAAVIEAPAQVEVFENAQVAISTYNWVTDTLFAAQNKFSVQPHFSCKIIDDLVTPNAITALNTPAANGTMVTAPDGSILAVGYDGSSSIMFWKGSNLHGGTWDSSYTFASGNTGSYLNGQNRITIACSDLINGSYHVDVYYFTNFVNDSSNLIAKHQYSDDGGVTWNTDTITMDAMPNSQYIAAPVRNLSVAALKPRLINGVLNSGFAWTVFTASYPGGYRVSYLRKVGASFTNQIPWARNVDSSDWMIHTIDSAYFNGKDYFVISGWKEVSTTPPVNSNYGKIGRAHV